MIGLNTNLEDSLLNLIDFEIGEFISDVSIDNIKIVDNNLKEYLLKQKQQKYLVLNSIPEIVLDAWRKLWVY